jgi:hypothetical protein
MTGHPLVAIILPGPVSIDPDVLRRGSRGNRLRRLRSRRRLHHDIARTVRSGDDLLGLLGDEHLLGLLLLNYDLLRIGRSARRWCADDV